MMGEIPKGTGFSVLLHLLTNNQEQTQPQAKPQYSRCTSRHCMVTAGDGKREVESVRMRISLLYTKYIPSVRI